MAEGEGVQRKGGGKEDGGKEREEREDGGKGEGGWGRREGRIGVGNL